MFLVLLGMYIDAVVIFVTSQTLLFRLALAILCTMQWVWIQWWLSYLNGFHKYLQLHFVSYKKQDSMCISLWYCLRVHTDNFGLSLAHVCILVKGRRNVWKFGWASIKVVGINCPHPLIERALTDLTKYGNWSPLRFRRFCNATTVWILVGKLHFLST